VLTVQAETRSAGVISVNLATLAAQLLRENRTEIVVVVRRTRPRAPAAAIPSSKSSGVSTLRVRSNPGMGRSIGAADSIAPPALASSGEYHARCAEFQNFVGSDTAAAEDFDVLHFVQLIQSVISYTRPSRESR